MRRSWWGQYGFGRELLIERHRAIGGRERQDTFRNEGVDWNLFFRRSEPARVFEVTRLGFGKRRVSFAKRHETLGAERAAEPGSVGVERER
jgi:hypothetical protein